MQLKSTLKCPNCGHTEQVIMPLDYCQFSYDCKSCHEIMNTQVSLKRVRPTWPPTAS